MLQDPTIPGILSCFIQHVSKQWRILVRCRALIGRTPSKDSLVRWHSKQEDHNVHDFWWVARGTLASPTSCVPTYSLFCYLRRVCHGSPQSN